MSGGAVESETWMGDLLIAGTSFFGTNLSEDYALY